MIIVLLQDGDNVAFTFQGVVKISLRATKVGVREIILHANDLNIIEYEYLGATVPYNVAQYDNVTDKWTIPLTADVSTVESVLTVRYSGYMRDDMAGFYRSYYMENNVKVWMASTQFQSASARRAFPCFDVKQETKLLCLFNFDDFSASRSPESKLLSV